MARITIHPSADQQRAWADAARRQGKPVGLFVAWAADFIAGYCQEEAIQTQHHPTEPLLARLEEKKPLRRLIDAAWHALEFLPPPPQSLAPGGIRDPKKDLREALNAVHDYLDEVEVEGA